MSPTPILAAVVYVMCFWALAAWRPPIALMLILAASSFQNDISGGGPVRFSLAEINLMLTLPVMLFRVRRWRFGPSLLPSIGYLLIGTLCSLPNWRGSTLTSLIQVTIYLIVVVAVFASVGLNEEDYRGALVGYVVVCSFLAVMVVVTRSGYILGLHKNGIGASLACALVVALELWLVELRKGCRFALLAACGILAAGCLLTVSRGAWLAAAVGVIVIFFLRRQFGLMLRIALVLTPILAIGWSMLPSEARDYATGFEGERENIRLRYDSMDFALEQFHANPILGMGVGLRKEYDATNFFLLTLAETGVAGVLALSFLYLIVARYLWRLHRQLSSDSLPFSLVAIASALMVGKLVHGMVDHYWTRGSLTVAWASLGMATFVGCEVRRLRREAELARLSELAGDTPSDVEPEAANVLPSIETSCA